MENMSRLSNGQATNKRLKLDSEEYKVSANNCITLHLFDPSPHSSSWPPRNVSSSFKPEFTHQIFGDDEEIVGYKGLVIDIYFSQRDFQACVAVAFEDKAHGATEIFGALEESFPGGLTQDKQQYLATVTKHAGASLHHLGSAVSVPGLQNNLLIAQANLAGGSQELKVSVLLQSDISSLGHGFAQSACSQLTICLQDLHARLQPFLLFFIDGASFIEADDSKWELLLATEQRAGQDIIVSSFWL